MMEAVNETENVTNTTEPVVATVEAFEDIFNDLDDNYSESYNSYPDYKGFVWLIERGFVRKFCLIAAAEHDQIWLNVDINDMIGQVTQSDLKFLYECGIFYDADIESLSLYT